MTEPPLPGASLSEAPADWQIVQQDRDGTAALSLAGCHRVEAPWFRIEARLVGEADGRPPATEVDWQPAELLPESRWRLTLGGVPAGGLYRLETRIRRAGCADLRPTRGDFVHHLGVGDLWVIAGQSNASGTGLGYADDPPTLGVHQLGNDEQWKLAAHPLEDATRTLHPITVHGVFQGHCPWLAFARRLRAELGWPIGLIPTALGGSPLAMWDPDQRGSLYDNLMAMVRAAGGRVRGLLWYQGESDGNAGLGDSYAEGFAAFVAAVRAALGEPDLPVLTAQLGRYTGDVGEAYHRGWSRVRQAQREVAATVPGVALIPAVDIPLSDEIHTSAAGNVLLGERFAVAALREVYGRDLPPPALRLLKAARGADPAVLRLTFERPPAGWSRPGRIRDFTVEDAQGTIPVGRVEVDDEGWVDLFLERAPGSPATIHCHYGCDPAYDLRDRDQRPVEAFSVGV